MKHLRYILKQMKQMLYYPPEGERDLMKATVRSIAEAAHVSPATVSRVFSGSARVSPQVRAQVLNLARELGYHGSEGRNIAVITSGITFSGYDGMILDALQRELAHRKFGAILIPAFSLSSLDECAIAGAISIVYSSGLEKIWSRNRAAPLVCINTTGFHLDGIYQVVSDEVMGIELALDHLFQFGHRKIGMVTLAANPRQMRGLSLRTETFQRVVQEHGGTGKVINIISSTRAPDAVRALLNAGVSAIFAVGESVGLPVTHALKLFQCRIPEDISLISYENSGISEHLDPPHTTISQRMERLASSAVDLIEKQLNGEHGLSDVSVDYCLHLRDSVAPPKP